MHSRYSLIFFLGLTVSAALPAAAQDSSFPACESQQEMEQVIQSDGELMPDGCSTLTITRIDSDTGELCVLNFETADPGVLDALQEEVSTTQWWVDCAELTSR